MLRALWTTSLALGGLLLTAGHHLKAQDAQPLPPLPGDSESIANGINNRGDVVGRSVGLALSTRRCGGVAMAS
jgi:hypothetical protein